MCVHIRKKNPTKNSLTRIRTAVSRSCSTTTIGASCRAFIALFYARGNLRKPPISIRRASDCRLSIGEFRRGKCHFPVSQEFECLRSFRQMYTNFLRGTFINVTHVARTERRNRKCIPIGEIFFAGYPPEKDNNVYCCATFV